MLPENESRIAAASSEVDDVRLAQILDEYLMAVERGDAVTPEALFARFPADAGRLRGYLSGLELFHAAAGRERLPASGQPLFRVKANQTIGDFRLVREIGRGGMGVVYEAWQGSLNRRVALKILPFTAANDSKQIGRFKNEAQAAAQVQHPNIVPVYAVGEEAGVHYYAMQLIDGRSLGSLLESMRSSHSPLDATTIAKRDAQTVCRDPLPKIGTPGATAATTRERRAPLSPAETAEHIRFVADLGRQAADALHAAHEFGVTHRDIKPSNLLLDAHGKLWISDFGLARCRESSGLTQTGDVLGTMRYMSPEQARGKPAAVDDRTDVYSLGVTLYELATLHHPADGVSDLAIYFERDYRVLKPLRQWNRHIPVDFQTVVLKALAESPQERYSSAEELANDLRRFLEDRPILASPPSAWTRTGKLLRRHRRAGLAAGLVLVVAFVAVLTAVAHGHAQTRRALELANRNLRQMSGVVERMASLSEQLAAIPSAEGVREQLLEDFLGYYRQLKQETDDDPAFVAESALANGKLGDVSVLLGDLQGAEAAYCKSISLWQQRLETDRDDAAAARNLALTQNNLGKLLVDVHRSKEALELLDFALALQNRLQAKSSDADEWTVEVATTRVNRALALGGLDKTKDAAAEFQQAIDLVTPLAQGATPNETALRTLAACYNNLGSLSRGSDGAHDSSAAVNAYGQAIAIQQRLVALNPINRLYQGDLGRTYNNLGYPYGQQQDWASAEKCFGDAIKLQSQLVQASPLAAAYRRDLAVSYNNRGMMQSRSGLSADAEASFRRALEQLGVLLAAQPGDGQSLSNRGSVFNNLGMLLDGRRQPAEAEKAYRQAIADQLRAYHESANSTSARDLLSRHYANLVKNLREQGRSAEAIDNSVERAQLWSGQPEQLFEVAQDLAAIHGAIRGDAEAAEKARCEASAIATLRSALTAGLSPDRLNDAAFDDIRDGNGFRTLLTGGHRGPAPPATAPHPDVAANR